jgi:hypothetical protein
VKIEKCTMEEDGKILIRENPCTGALPNIGLEIYNYGENDYINC